MDVIFFVGSYTEMLSEDFGGHGEGIYTMSLDSATGELTLLHTFYTRNPSYLTLSDDKKYLYTNTEVASEKSPQIQAFEIQDNYSLRFINELPIVGSLPCHIDCIQNNLIVSCYGSGNVLAFSTAKSGELLENTANVYHSGSSINKARQEAPHAHQAVFCTAQKKIYVPDLGIDSIKVYEFIKGSLIELKSEEIFITKGFGPRHLVFNKIGNLGYLINELTAEVSVLTLENNTFIQKSVYATLPKTYKETPSASAIRLHPHGQFLYVGNRILDAITIFKIEGGALIFVDCKLLTGKTVREFVITPDGNWLIACFQDSDEIKTYRINSNGKLIENQFECVIKSPVAALFLDK